MKGGDHTTTRAAAQETTIAVTRSPIFNDAELKAIIVRLEGGGRSSPRLCNLQPRKRADINADSFSGKSIISQCRKKKNASLRHLRGKQISLSKRERNFRGNCQEADKRGGASSPYIS